MFFSRIQVLGKYVELDDTATKNLATSFKEGKITMRDLTIKPEVH
jgi:hypothetical protein